MDAMLCVFLFLLSLVTQCSSFVEEREPPTEGDYLLLFLFRLYFFAQFVVDYGLCHFERDFVMHFLIYLLFFSFVIIGFKHVTCGSTIKLGYVPSAGFKLHSHEVAYVPAY